jgi:pimeloyl-ACP methyl ester carboxylesterase
MKPAFSPQETRTAFPRHEIDALGVKTNYYHSGSRHLTPVLLLHGTSTSGDSFRELMRDLSDICYLIAPDIPGFGESEMTEPYSIDHLVEWLASLVDHLNLDPVTLIGHSFGGMLAVAYALKYPEDVERLLLYSPAILVGQNVPQVLKSIGEGMRLAEAGIALSRVMLEKQIRIQFFDPSDMEEGIWDRRRVDYANARATAAALNAVAMTDLTTHLSEITQPTLIVWGEDDPILTSAHAEVLNQLIPNSSIEYVPACGHVPMLEQRSLVSAISREFIL